MDPLFRQNHAVETSPIQEELIVFNPQSGKFCILNQTSTSMWALLKHPSSAEQLAEAVTRSFGGVDIGQARHDVEIMLQDMLKLSLVVQDNNL
jgi:hypothetical protein